MSSPAASPMQQLSQPQPGYSIPCASSPLPSESASHPLRSSALPLGSATPFSPTSTGVWVCVKAVCVSLSMGLSVFVCLFLVSNMANPKEKTPMCLVNELARFNKIQPEYKLLCEQGPAHSKVTRQRSHWYSLANLGCVYKDTLTVAKGFATENKNKCFLLNKFR